MASAVKKEFGGRTFIFTKLPASKGTPLLWLIAPAIPTFIKLRSKAFEGIAKGVAAATVAKGAGEKPTEKDMQEALGGLFDDGGIEKLIMEIRKALTPAEFMEVMSGLFESVQIALGSAVQQLDMDVHFDGVSPVQMQVFGEAMRVNFGGFLAGKPSDSSAEPTAPT